MIVFSVLPLYVLHCCKSCDRIVFKKNNLSGSEMRVNQWASGEPSGRDGGECVILSTNVSTGRAALKTHSCNDSLPFICKFGAPSEFSFSY